MRIKYDSDFLKTLKKVDVRIRNRFKERIAIFLKNPLDQQLNNHALKDQWVGYQSIDITNDWRVIYTEKIEGEETIVYFFVLGTHEQLYK